MTHRKNTAAESHQLNTFGRRPEDGQLMINSLYDSPWRSSPLHPNGRPDDRGTSEETEKFLSPVKLDPGLETIDDESYRKLQKVEELERNPPTDRFFLVYIVMVIHGIGILMPWNMFINAKDYFENYKLNSTESPVREYQKNFLYYIGLASQFPNVFMSLINFCCQCGGSASVRIIISLLIMVCVFILTAALAMIDTSQWQATFFIVTMVSVVILNMAAGVYQNSMYGLAALLPMKYTNAIVFGNNFSGTLIAVINIITIAGAPNIRTAAIYYFVAAIVVLLIAFDAYFILPLIKFYRYFQRIVQLKQMVSKEPGQENYLSGLKKYWFVFKKIWDMVFCVWFVFFVTLSLFPAIQSDIRRINFPISDAYWVPIFCFLNFNLFAMLGNLTTEFVKIPGPRFLWIPVLLRGLIFIPIFLLCNYQPRLIERGIPVYIPNDYVYIVTAVLMSFTSGYYSSLAMMYAPKQVEPEYAGTAGMMMALFLVVGIVSGVNFSIVLTMIVEKIKV